MSGGRTADALVDEALALGEGLGRPLRYVQLNSFHGGSTGGVMRGLHAGLLARGADSWALWGRGPAAEGVRGRRVATAAGVLSHALAARLTDRAGFYSGADTRRLLALLDGLDPDVVHLHNVHGYWVDVEALFGWLAGRRCLVRWTLHDCWAFTGHCPHFTCAGCGRWAEPGGCRPPCPQRGGYPRSLLLDSSGRNFEDKRRAFTSVPPGRMTLLSPSEWLAGLVRRSFLGGYQVEVRRNAVDRSVFRPTPGDFRERHGVGGRFMVLGVASPWTERKGLGDLVRLAGELDPGRYAVVAVGLTARQARQAKRESPAFVGLPRTGSARELAEAYTAADVFFNPTREDNFPTVNLEAEACGTPVVTYDTGGCGETLSLTASAVASSYIEVKAYIEHMGKTFISSDSSNVYHK